MKRSLGYLVVAFSLALPSWCVDKSASIAGYVHNSSGSPQIGAVVRVIGSAAQVLNLITDDKGSFRASGLVPGIYSVKVSAPAFLPTLREKISLKAGASVLLNLTLSTVFDALQFTPRQGRPETMTGIGYCAQPPAVRCCALCPMVLQSWSRTNRHRAT